MPYRSVLTQQTAGLIVRELCVSDAELAQVLADALKNHAAPPPKAAPAISANLQGNLGEFGVWDLGERHWLLYQKPFTWTANADSPWKANSTDGIDILAFVPNQPCQLLVVEAKTTTGNGSNLITGNNSALIHDFQKLFEGSVQERLMITVGKALASLRLVHGRPDLEEKLKNLVGPTPAQCPALRLVGVIICHRGSAVDEAARARAFDRLRDALTAAGWNIGQLEFRTIEVTDLNDVLQKIVASVIV